MNESSTPTDFVFNIIRQEKYSRGQLILRTLFGQLFILLPHAFLLFFIGIGSFFLGFFAWWAVLFTGVYPRSFFEFQIAVIKWNTRLQARILHLSDGYPAFGMNSEDEKIVVNIPYPQKLSQGLLLLRLFFQFIYVIIPHGFLLFFRCIAMIFAIIVAWWAVLFTGQYPKGLYDFVVGTLRWSTRVSIYLSFLTDTYPPFSGKE